MFRNHDIYKNESDRTDRMFLAVFGLCAIGVTILGVAAIKQDMAETKEALAAGKNVYQLFGQKVIV